MRTLKCLEKSESSRFHPALWKVRGVGLTPLWVRLCKHHSTWHSFPDAVSVAVSSYHQLKAMTPCSVAEVFCGALLKPIYIFLTRFWAWFGFKSSRVISAAFRCVCKNFLGTGLGYNMAPCKEAGGASVNSSMRGHGWVTAVRGGMRSTWAVASLGRSPALQGSGVAGEVRVWKVCWGPCLSVHPETEQSHFAGSKPR